MKIFLMPKRSPFPKPALPQAGESLREAAHDLFIDRFFAWAMAAGVFTAVGFVEWVLRLLHAPMSSWNWVWGGVFCGLVALRRWFTVRPQMRNLIQGMRGEREVGRMLEKTRLLGYEVFHDLPGDGFNVDHVLVGPGGIFAIETKTWSMPEGRRAEILYDGEQVTADGFKPDRDPVKQASASADFVRDMLKRTTGRDPAVRPVVLFPGWWVTQKQRDARVWVLNPKALQSFLANEPASLKREDMALYADRVTRFFDDA